MSPIHRGADRIAVLLRRGLRPLAVVLPLAACTTVAEDSGPYDGHWRATYRANGATWTTGLSIHGAKGTWEHFYMPEFAAKLNPCFGRDMPITVLVANAEELKFEISRSKAITGCADRIVRVTPVDHDHLSGWIGEGKGALTMVRG